MGRARAWRRGGRRSPGDRDRCSSGALGASGSETARGSQRARRRHGDGHAGAVAAMLRALEDVKRPAMALVMSVLAIGGLVAHDVGLAPDRVLVAFGAGGTAIPAGHAVAASLAIRSSVWLCVVLASFALIM